MLNIVFRSRIICLSLAMFCIVSSHLNVRLPLVDNGSNPSVPDNGSNLSVPDFSLLGGS